MLFSKDSLNFLYSVLRVVTNDQEMQVGDRFLTCEPLGMVDKMIKGGLYGVYILSDNNMYIRTTPLASHWSLICTN